MNTESSVHGVNNELNIQDTMKHSSESVMTNEIGPEVCLDFKSAKNETKRRL